MVYLKLKLKNIDWFLHSEVACLSSSVILILVYEFHSYANELKEIKYSSESQTETPVDLILTCINWGIHFERVYMQLQYLRSVIVLNCFFTLETSTQLKLIYCHLFINFYFLNNCSFIIIQNGGQGQARYCLVQV